MPQGQQKYWYGAMGFMQEIKILVFGLGTSLRGRTTEAIFQIRRLLLFARNDAYFLISTSAIIGK
jgi:hypothetical protein